MDGIIDSMDMSLSKLRDLVMDRKAGVLQCMGSQRVRHDRSDLAAAAAAAAACMDVRVGL